MSVPSKPWNSATVLNRVAAVQIGDLTESLESLIQATSRFDQSGVQKDRPGVNGSRPYSQSPLQPVSYGPLPPPVPPRPDQATNNVYGYNRYGSGYRGYQRPMYGLGSPLGGLGYNSQMMYGNDFYGPDRLQNSFIRFAEESSRPAFQSIESLVNGVNSISFMLESTFYAFQSSYQAVLGVADQFSRLRSHMTQMITTLALLRNMRWLLRKMLYLLGLRNDYLPDSAWDTASQVTNGNVPQQNSSNILSTSWPVLMFLGFVLLGPWLLSRLFSKAVKDIQATKLWASGKGDYLVGIATHDFRAASSRELSFRAGQKMRIAPKNLQLRNKDWLLASVDGQNIGRVPSNYIVLRYPANAKPKHATADLSSTTSVKLVDTPSDKAQQDSDTNVVETVGEMEFIPDDTCIPPEEEKNSA